MVSTMLFRVRSMVPAKLIRVSVATGRAMCPTISHARCPTPDSSQTPAANRPAAAMLPSRMSRAPAIRLLDVSRKTANTMSDPTIAVIIIRLNTVLASTGASRHNTGSRNLPIGNQPALNANSQIIMRANQGVNTVYSTTPPSVDAYSVQPPLRQAIILPRENPR